MVCSRMTCLHQRMLCSTLPLAKCLPKSASGAVADAIRDWARVHPKPSLLSPYLASYKATRSTHSGRHDPHLSCGSPARLCLNTATLMPFPVESTSASLPEPPRYQLAFSIPPLCYFSFYRQRSMIERPATMRRLKL